jgi:DNA-binding SARP family transcriptional activator
VTYGIEVVGGWRLVRADGQIQRARYPVQRLLAFLVVCGRVQQRTLVAGSLWPDSSERRASANLRAALWHARSECPGIVDGDGSTVWLPDEVGTDFDAATQTIRAALRGRAVPLQDLAVLQHDLLPGWDDEWVIPVRFLHRQLRLLALELTKGDATVTAASPTC